MYRKNFLACGAAALMAVALACSKKPASPVTPTPAQTEAADAAPDGSTLKVSAPNPQSPVGGVVADTVVLVASASTAEFTQTPSLSYAFEIRSADGSNAICNATVAGSGSTVSWTPSCSLEFDTPYTWRVRATYQGSNGPWSSTASFRTAAGAYIREQEIRDVLTNGTTVGQRIGSVDFVPGVGARLNTTNSYIAYQLPRALQEGEFSFLATNVDEGNVCDKCKVMVMAEGCHVDVTDNDYRMTLEVRGSQYVSPGMISYRIITGITDNHRDTSRTAMTWTRTATYFFKMWWRTGRGGYEIRENGPTGRIVDAKDTGTDGRQYRPNPHCIYVGSGPARGGSQDATHAGMIAKHVWVSAAPRPNFPTVE